MARIFTTCMVLMLLFTAFAAICTFSASTVNIAVAEVIGVEPVALGIEKHVFIFDIGLASAWFALAMVFIGRMKAKGTDYFTPVNLNVIATALAACILVGMAIFVLGGSESVRSEGAGMLFGSAFSAVLGGGSGLTMALAKRDDEPEDTEGG